MRNYAWELQMARSNSHSPGLYLSSKRLLFSQAEAFYRVSLKSQHIDR